MAADLLRKPADSAGRSSTELALRPTRLARICFCSELHHALHKPLSILPIRSSLAGPTHISKLITMFASNKLPTRNGSPAAKSSQLASMYNDGNDDIATMNRFSFPAISFSPSFPLDASPRSATSGSKRLLSPRSPAIASGNAFGNALSPRSPHRSSITASSASSGSLPGANAPSRSSSTNSHSSVGNESLHPSTPCSPLPPLSPRGQKLADSENYHKNKCLTRIVEKRRKASDGTQDIVYLEPATPPHLGHMRRVSFKLSSQGGKPGAGTSMPSSICWSSQATAASSSPGSGACSLPVGVCDTMPAESAGSQTSHPSSISPFEIRFSLSNEDMDCSGSPSSPAI